ncbi:MAG: acyl-CoA carboxylase subunit beta [Bradymonadales bacterium]|jgi:methylmalonyl-CoA carboxyltransferase large subunit
MSVNKRKNLEAKIDTQRAMGGEARLKKQASAGKLNARERIELLFDKDAFQETNLFWRHRISHFGLDSKEFPAQGVITGYGKIEARSVCAASQDFTVSGGSVGEATADKIAQIMKQALQTGTPFIFINDSAGARIQEGVAALAGYGKIFHTNVMLSGVVPQISIIAGPCAGGASYSPALTDFIIQVKNRGQLYITGPSVIKEVTGEVISLEDLGGAMTHASKSGVSHFVAEDDEDAIRIAKRILSFLPNNNLEDPPIVEENTRIPRKAIPALDSIIPDDPKKAYDVREVIRALVDHGDFLEVHELFAPNIVVAFARIEGRSIGIVANQPAVRAGILDCDASDKAARFVRFCDAFNIPLVTLVDVPGYMPGSQQESMGIIRHGAKLLYAFSEASVPKLTVVMRKAYGGAYIAMCSKTIGADACAAWPSAEIAVMGASGAVQVLYAKELKAAQDPKALSSEKINEYQEKFANPYESASLGLLDAIIHAQDTRNYLAHALSALQAKRERLPSKKHGNIPL